MAWPLAQGVASVSRLQQLGALAALILGGVCSSAQAGAWTPKKGEVGVIASTSISQTNADPRALTYDLYYERGLGHGWALVLTPSISDQDNVFTRNEAQVSLRRSLFENDDWALSAQPGAYVWREGADADPSTGLELRLAAGRIFGKRGWANVEAAMRDCNGQSGVRWEGTIGHAVRRYDKAIVKVFGDSEGCAANINRVQASYVLGLNSRFGVELGWRETLPNAGNWNERGVVVGIWARF